MISEVILCFCIHIGFIYKKKKNQRDLFIYIYIYIYILKSAKLSNHMLRKVNSYSLLILVFKNKYLTIIAENPNIKVQQQSRIGEFPTNLDVISIYYNFHYCRSFLFSLHYKIYFHVPTLLNL
jgi:hypothetical protein